MNQRFYPTDGQLSKFISNFYAASLDKDLEQQSYSMVPNLEMILVLNFGPPIDISFGGEVSWSHQIIHYGVIGPLRKCLNYRMRPGCDFIGVNFTLDGFYKLFNVSLKHKKGDSVLDPIEIYNSDQCTALRESLNQCENTDQKVELLKIHFMDLMSRATGTSRLILSCTQEDSIVCFDTAKFVSSKMNVTQRSAQLLYKKHLGYSSTEKSIHERFKQLIKYLIENKPDNVNWVALAYVFGYYDQSHMIRDFKKFLQTTPQYFLFNIDRFCVSRHFIGNFYDENETEAI